MEEWSESCKQNIVLEYKVECKGNTFKIYSYWCGLDWAVRYSIVDSDNNVASVVEERDNILTNIDSLCYSEN